MPYEDTRKALISAGLREMLRGGYDSVGIATVLSQTGVPKGSFYHYFPSKEAFGCAIIEAYREQWREARQLVFAREDLSPMARLDAHFTDLEQEVCRQDSLGGCLLGNLSQLMASRNELLRNAIETGFMEWQQDLATVLAAARRAGELPQSSNPEELAALVIEAYEGALVRAKAQASLAPLRRFRCSSLNRLLGA